MICITNLPYTSHCYIMQNVFSWTHTIFLLCMALRVCLCVCVWVTWGCRIVIRNMYPNKWEHLYAPCSLPSFIREWFSCDAVRLVYIASFHTHTHPTHNDNARPYYTHHGYKCLVRLCKANSQPSSQYLLYLFYTSICYSRFQMCMVCRWFSGEKKARPRDQYILCYICVCGTVKTCINARMVDGGSHGDRSQSNMLCVSLQFERTQHRSTAESYHVHTNLIF